MALIDWRRELSLGIPSIDEQHQGLIVLVNRIEEEISGGTTRVSCLGSFFFELIRTTQQHFAHEEALFARTGYHCTAAHGANHSLLLRQLWGSRQAFDVGQRTLSVRLMVFLGGWLTSHIEGADQRYAAFMRGELPSHSAGRRLDAVGVASDMALPVLCGGSVLVA